MVVLKKPTSSDIRKKHYAENALNNNKNEFFALEGGVANGYWKSEFDDERVSRVDITPTKDREDILCGAKIYIG